MNIFNTEFYKKFNKYAWAPKSGKEYNDVMSLIYKFSDIKMYENWKWTGNGWYMPIIMSNRNSICTFSIDNSLRNLIYIDKSQFITICIKGHLGYTIYGKEIRAY